MALLMYMMRMTPQCSPADARLQLTLMWLTAGDWLYRQSGHLLHRMFAGLEPGKHLGKTLAQVEPHLHRLARCLWFNQAATLVLCSPASSQLRTMVSSSRSAVPSTCSFQQDIWQQRLRGGRRI